MRRNYDGRAWDAIPVWMQHHHVSHNSIRRKIQEAITAFEYAIVGEASQRMLIPTGSSHVAIFLLVLVVQTSGGRVW